jgi:hypothetical protein
MKKISKIKSFKILLIALFLGGMAHTPMVGFLVFVGILIAAILQFEFVKSERSHHIVMGDDLNIEDTTWSGKALQYMIRRAVVDSDTIINDVACILQEMGRKAITIPRLEVAVLMQHYTPDPVDAGVITVDGQHMTLNKFEYYAQFNPQDFEQHFFEQDFDETRLIDETLPDIAENFIMLQAIKRINEWFENGWYNSRKMWDPTGSNVNPTTKGYSDDTLQTNANFFFDGWLYKLLSDSTTQTLAYSPANFTSANLRVNVLGPLKKTLMTNNISKALSYKYGKLGLRYLMSYADQYTHEQAQITDLYKNPNSTERGINEYVGHDAVPVAGLDEGTILLTCARPDFDSNLFIGMNSTEDVMLEMKKKAFPSDMWGIKAIFKIDTAIGFGDQAVICTPVTL